MALTSSSSSASSTHLLHHLFTHPKPPPITVNSYLYLRPSYVISTQTQKLYFIPKPLLRNPPQSFPFFTSPSSPSILSSRSISSSAAESVTDSALYPDEEEDEKQELADNDLSSLLEEEEEEEEEVEEGTFSALLEEDDDEEDKIEDESDKSLPKSLHDTGNGSFDEGIEENEGFYVENSKVGLNGKNEKPTKPLPNLTIKEKKELASYAHSLGKKLKCQLVGKSGVTDTVVFSFDETLEKNELMKIKVLRNCPDELEDVVRYLEKATGSVVVGEIGRTVILYRPSVTKLKAEEKRKESQRLFMKRTSRFRPGPPGYPRREYETRTAGRGRRGISRVRNASY